MKLQPILITFLLLISVNFVTKAQTDSSSQQLLPENYLFTQKILWSEHGLMRNFSYFKLTPESREREINIRNYTIKAHQLLGFAALAGMAGQAIVGTKLYNGDYSIKDLHEGLSVFTNTCYFTSAALILFSPPPMHNREPGISQFKLHKYIAPLHLTGMIATNILAEMLESNPNLKPYHRAAAFTAFASYFTAMVIIKI